MTVDSSDLVSVLWRTRPPQKYMLLFSNHSQEREPACGPMKLWDSDVAAIIVTIMYRVVPLAGGKESLKLKN